jgi:son of sevenless-like protein
LQLFRIKFVKVLGDWMKEHFYDFTEDCVKEVLAFLEEALAKQHPRFYETLKATITKQLENRTRKIVRTPNIQPPPPELLTDSPIITDLFQIAPVEFARQMTLRDEEVYRKIKPRELMNQAYSQKDVAHIISPNVVQLISRFNQISAWVQTAIVKETQYKRRKKTLSRFIKIAGKLREIKNFHSMMAIVLGVMSPPVSRLKKTWEGVASANIKTYEELQQICHPAKNHEALRTALKLIVPPCVPWLGLYLRDLTFADENKNIWPNDDESVELVNLEKLRLVSTLIHDATFFQVDYYNFTVVPEIQDYLAYGESQVLTTKELDEWSLKAEPKTM